MASTLVTVAVCGSAKKHAQSFDSLKAAAAEHNEKLKAEANLPALATTTNTTAVETNHRPSSGTASLRNTIFRIVNLNYDDVQKSMYLSTGENQDADEEVSGGGGGAAGSSSSCGGSSVPRGVDVDIVIHKVHTFGSPDAVRALSKWCQRVDKEKTKASPSRRRLIVVDPMDKVQLLTARSLLYQLLDAEGGSGGHPVALIPRTFKWVPPRPRHGSKDDDYTPVGIHSFVVLDQGEQMKRRAAGPPGERWWIIKPEEGTGPAYTHHMLLWKSCESEPSVPPAVQQALPSEPSAFIIQEFYAYALPVVVKVYCIDSRVFIKVSPTLKLLSQLAAQTAYDAPVFMDSQDKKNFSSDGLSNATSDAFSPAAVANSIGGGGDGIDGALTAVVPPQLWKNFFEPGSAAHTAISKLAYDLSSGPRGLGLRLFGFDVLLVPRDLAHTYQRDACSKGIGYPDTFSPSAIKRMTDGAAANASGAHHVGLGYEPAAMFDMTTGKPTALLCGSIPVVIDVNFFPGYSGMATAQRDMLQLFADAHHQHQQHHRGKEKTSNDRRGSKQKERKRLCTSM